MPMHGVDILLVEDNPGEVGLYWLLLNRVPGAAPVRSRAAPAKGGTP